MLRTYEVVDSSSNEVLGSYITYSTAVGMARVFLNRKKAKKVFVATLDERGQPAEGFRHVYFE